MFCIFLYRITNILKSFGFKKENQLPLAEEFTLSHNLMLNKQSLKKNKVKGTFKLRMLIEEFFIKYSELAERRIHYVNLEGNILQKFIFFFFFF